MVDPTPNTPEPVASATGNNYVKIADPDVILFDDASTPVEVMTDLIFEEIGGQEIINISRNDLVNGQNVIYRPIKNLEDIYVRYNPRNIMALQEASDDIFNSFPIKYVNHVPEEGNGPGGSYVYVDPTTGDIVIDVVKIEREEQVDVEVVNTVTSFDDTIYIEGSS